MMLKSFNAQKAINAAVGAEYSALMRRPTHLEGGTVYTVPAAGECSFSPVREKRTREWQSHSHRGALRCGFFATPYIINRVTLIVAKGLRSLWRIINPLKT